MNTIPDGQLLNPCTHVLDGTLTYTQVDSTPGREEKLWTDPPSSQNLQGSSLAVPPHQ